MEALSAPAGYTQTRLSALILRNNILTAKALKHLAPVIAAACGDLNIIDLGSNRITVNDDADAASLEAFLKALGMCHNLLRIDFAQNDLGESRFFEVFSKIYLKQFKTAIVIWLDNLCGASGFGLSVVSGGADAQQDNANNAGKEMADAVQTLSMRDTNKQKPKEAGYKGSNVEKICDEVQPVAGLPTIPFIDFKDCFVGDAGALWLSWVVQRHRWYQESILGHTWGSSDDNGAWIWILPNSTLSAAAKKMLKLAENSRYQTATLTGIDEYLQHPVFDSDLFADMRRYPERASHR